MKNPEVGFVREVKVAFQDDRDKYDQFRKAFEDYKFKRIQVSVFKEKLKSLFQGHEYLFWEYNRFVPKEHRLECQDKDVLAFLKAVKVAVNDDDYGDFSKVMEDYSKRKIDEMCLLARVKVLFRGHANLIREFNALFLPTRSHITIPPWDQLWDVLDVISRKLDFDDLFQFSRVCANWRVFHKSIDESKLLTEPLLVEFFNSPRQVQFSLTSLPNQKVYPLKNMMMNMLSYSNDFFPVYVTCSSGYFVIVADNSSFLLINPFTRIKKKVICPSTFKFTHNSLNRARGNRYRALLAFDKCSDEFVLVFLFKKSTSVHVYQSRNNGWVTYSTKDEYDDDENKNIVCDFVAFNNIIYVVTEEARIGVLSLNSAKIEFLKMVNSSYNSLNRELEIYRQRPPLYLVECDEELLLVRFLPDRKVYKIDFSTMTYGKLETLGDIALFHVCFKSCKALSNPKRWGYDSNSVYEVCHNNPNCTIYNWDKNSKKSQKYIGPPNLTNGLVFDWCFRHLKNEVDCSI